MTTTLEDKIIFIIKLLFIAFGFVSAFICLQLFFHYQDYTEYLVYYDTWQYFEKPRTNQPLSSYFYHNVHTYAIPSLLLYLDTVFNEGSLRFVHRIVALANLLSFCVIAYLFTLIQKTKQKMRFAFCCIPLGIAFWLSPSNLKTFTYPALDILASISLLAISLLALISQKIFDHNSGERNAQTLFYLFLL